MQASRARSTRAASPPRSGSGARPSPPAIYYEVKQPGAPARYHGVLGVLRPGEKHRVRVRETGRASWWRVSVDGRPASAAIPLPRSHGRWYGDAEAESWNGGRVACNRFAFSFEDVAVGETD